MQFSVSALLSFIFSDAFVQIYNALIVKVCFGLFVLTLQDIFTPLTYSLDEKTESKATTSVNIFELDSIKKLRLQSKDRKVSPFNNFTQKGIAMSCN